MVELIVAGIAIAVLSVITTCMIVSEKKKNTLFPDDGIVWPDNMGDWVKKVK